MSKFLPRFWTFSSAIKCWVKKLFTLWDRESTVKELMFMWRLGISAVQTKLAYKTTILLLANLLACKSCLNFLIFQKQLLAVLPPFYNSITHHPIILHANISYFIAMFAKQNKKRTEKTFLLSEGLLSNQDCFWFVTLGIRYKWMKPHLSPENQKI